MDELVAHLGPLRLKLSTVEHRVAPRIDGAAFLRLSDGTEVRVAGGAEPYLFVDYRRDANVSCRVEFWECLEPPEGNLRGLLVMTDAARLIPLGALAQTAR